MEIAFLNPWFLLGGGAVAVPILIHRLTRRRAIVRRFSAVRLLIRSQQVMSRPQRIKHLLLLGLRVAAVLALALLMARPMLVGPGLLDLSDRSATVLILDNSMSMGYEETKGSRFGLAKEAARQIIERVRGKVLLLSTASPDREARWATRSEALQELERIPLVQGRGDPLASLGSGFSRLKEVRKEGQVLMLTDLVRGDWEGFDLGKLGTPLGGERVKFLRIGGRDRDPNVAVQGLRLSGGDAVAGSMARLEVILSNYSDGGLKVLAGLYLSGEKREQKALSLDARREGRISFDLHLERPGQVEGEVRISNDRLPLDDRLRFSMTVREKVKVLVVDGDPRTSLKGAESYFVAHALQPGGSETSPFQARVVTEEEFSRIDPRPYEALFLLNVAEPAFSKLLPFLEKGRPVFIFLGDRVLPEAYHAFPVSGWKIREVREKRGLRIRGISTERPILRSLSASGAESLRAASFQRYFKIEGGGRELLTFENGDPFLVEADFGQGKVFLFASTADLEWNDLPLKAAFLPLIQGLLRETTGLTEDRLSVKLDRALEESDLSKLGVEEMAQRFGGMELNVLEYNEEVLKGLDFSRKELWPYLLSFLLLVLGIETIVAGRI
ncbi:MAG: BatA and WFA domain-containing protein [Desulfobacterota bacterium]|nr:BatA and WFA domain-containing protein [Thermodesulfobacteriota bacterium]